MRPVLLGTDDYVLNPSTHLAPGRVAVEHAGVVCGKGILVVLGEVGGCVRHTTREDHAGQDVDQLALRLQLTVARNALQTHNILCSTSINLENRKLKLNFLFT